MKELLLGGKLAKQLGLVAFVDDADFERVNKLPWHPNKSTCSNGSFSTWYAQGSPSSLLLHRFILGVTDPRVKVDHIDRNGLNNVRSNLRIGTHSQNLANRPKAKANSSGYKGVYAAGTKWISTISFQDKLRFLGRFENREDAARAYDKAALEQWGEFAYLNFSK